MGFLRGLVRPGRMTEGLTLRHMHLLRAIKGFGAMVAGGAAMIVCSVLVLGPVMYLAGGWLFFKGTDDACPWESQTGEPYGDYSVQHSWAPATVTCIYADGARYRFSMTGADGWIALAQ